MSKPRGLGRGLDSLIPTEIEVEELVKPQGAIAKASKDSIIQVDPAKVVPNPHQPRTDFDAEELQGLAESIKKHGIVHPPVVSDTGNGIYELIAGERRVRAAKLAGLKQMPVIVRSYDEQQKLELALLENVQRTGLNPVETALAYRKLSDEFNLSLDEIGARMGKAKSTVANTMRLLQLPKEALSAMIIGKLSEGHGRTLLAIEGGDRAELLARILKESWSVRQAEDYVKDVKTGVKTPGSRSDGVAVKTGVKTSRQTENHLTRELADHLGTKVTMQEAAKGGKLVIEYYSDEELQRIFEAIKPE